MVDVDKIRRDLDKYFTISRNVKINPSTGVVDVDGNVKLHRHSSHLPFKFGKVNGEFNCSENTLISLAGSPRYVGGDFYCYDNRLTSLSGAPAHVGGNFYCRDNQLTSLVGAPAHVGDSFYCINNQLTSLEGTPRHVGDSFYCSNNQLTSLEGAPDHVSGNFDCVDNQLTSLKGAPNHVGADFYCDDNPLTSLDGAPDHVDKFICTYSKSLPLLRLVVYPRIIIYNAPSDIKEIINKYRGQGKPGALRAAAELIRAGYKENARW